VHDDGRAARGAEVRQPWELYETLGVLVGAGANLMSFTAHYLFLPNWFVRRRGLAIGIALSGASVGAIVLLPWLQAIIGRRGWRAACWAMGLLDRDEAGAVGVKSGLIIWCRVKLIAAAAFIEDSTRSRRRARPRRPINALRVDDRGQRWDGDLDEEISVA
jgi:hypothetical protein